MLPNFKFFISKQFSVLGHCIHPCYYYLTTCLLKSPKARTKVNVHVTFSNLPEKPFWKEISQLWLWILVRFWDRKRLGMNQYFCVEVMWSLWAMNVVIVGIHVLHQQSMCACDSDFCQLLTLTEKKSWWNKGPVWHVCIFSAFIENYFPWGLNAPLCLWHHRASQSAVRSLALSFVSTHY